MTVAELIVMLQHVPPDLQVAVDLHSEYAPAEYVKSIRLIDKRGFLSEVYDQRDNALAREYIYIG
jgi:hypothetical protein